VRTTVISVLVTLILATQTTAAPQAELWPRWQRHDPSSTVNVDHGLWASFLERYLVTSHPSGIDRVAYDAVDPPGRALLDRYIADLAGVSPDTLHRTEQLPYWINLYNALTVRMVLENYPLDSIRDIDDPWSRPVVTIDGQELTLNDIEHRIIRPIWRDSRIHYLVNCASIGCPNLPPEPLTAANYDERADQAAREFINHPRGVRFEQNRLILSAIFDWYAEDFGEDRSALLEHLMAYAHGDTANQLRGYRGRIRYRYDWSLNEP